MTLPGWLQISLILGLVALTARPLGLYMARVFSGERTLLTPVLAPVERGFYTLAGVTPEREQGWLAYTIAMLAFSAVGFASPGPRRAIRGSPRGMARTRSIAAVS